MSDNITLPRELVFRAVKVLSPMAYHTWPRERKEVVDAFRAALAAPSEDVEALRRDAERYRWLRDKVYVWDSDMPKAMRPVALWLHDAGNADIDAVIDAAKENKT